MSSRFFENMAELNLQNLEEFVSEQLAGTDCFPVKVAIVGRDITVEIDSDSRVDIDFVAALNRKIEDHFAPEIDDYNLEVGSVGLTTPLRLPRQFRKNRGNDVIVMAKDGKKYSGMLRDADDEGFTIVYQEKVKLEGEKRPTMRETEKHFGYDEVKSVVYDLKF